MSYGGDYASRRILRLQNYTKRAGKSMKAIEHIRQADTILVTFLMHLGDLVLTTPFLHVLRQAAPQAKITYLVDEKLKDIVQYNRNIDEVITIDKKGKDKSITALWQYAQKLRSRRFDLLISLHPNERCSFCAPQAGLSIRRGLCIACSSLFLMRRYVWIGRSTPPTCT